MKIKLTFFICILFCGSLFAQNITNTLGSTGTFSIKDNINTFLSLNQSNGTINLIASLAGNQQGSIFKGGNRFLHTYNGNGTDGQNTFLGINSGNFIMSGSGSQGSYNSAFGTESMFLITTGANNSAFGYRSLFINSTGSRNSAYGTYSLTSNTTGNQNSAFGTYTLYSNTSGFQNSAFGESSLYSNTSGLINSAFGYSSLRFNTTGTSNSAFGYVSLRDNTTGNQNSAFGTYTLNTNTTGSYNSAFGDQSLYYNFSGNQNSAFGLYSLYNNSTGNDNSAFGFRSLLLNSSGINNSAFGNNSLLNNSTGSGNTAIGYYTLSNSIGNYNTALGDSAGRNITSGSNNIAIGYNSQVPFGTSSNQIRLGNTSITHAGIQVAWTVTSDRNLKSNIYNTNLGLGFISKLRPVSYTRKNDESNKTEYGLIAQEVEEVLQQEGIENTGMLTITDEGEYQLRYNDLIAPMIKAIQELKTENEGLKTKNEKLEIRLAEFEEIQNKLTGKLEQIELKQNDVKEVKLGEN